MIRFSLLSACFLIASFTATCQSKKPIVFIITKTIPYCGGANRTEDLETKSTRKKTVATETFYIIKGTVNTAGRSIIQRFSMGNAGKACIALSPGNYAVINKFSYQKLIIDKNRFDAVCLKQLWETPLFTFRVGKNKTETIVYNVEPPCEYNQPCAKLNNDIPM